MHEMCMQCVSSCLALAGCRLAPCVSAILLTAQKSVKQVIEKVEGIPAKI